MLLPHVLSCEISYIQTKCWVFQANTSTPVSFPGSHFGKSFTGHTFRLYVGIPSTCMPSTRSSFGKSFTDMWFPICRLVSTVNMQTLFDLERSNILKLLRDGNFLVRPEVVGSSVPDQNPVYTYLEEKQSPNDEDPIRPQR